MSGFIGFLSLLLTGYLAYLSYGAWGGDEPSRFYILAAFASFWFFITCVVYLLGHIARLQTMMGAQLFGQAQAMAEGASSGAPELVDERAYAPQDTMPEPPQGIERAEEGGVQEDEAPVMEQRVRKVTRRKVKRTTDQRQGDESLETFTNQDPNRLFDK